MKYGYLGSIPDNLSGSVSSGDLGPNVVVSGTIGSGAVWGFFGPTRIIASGTVGVWDFGSGAVVAGAVGSGAIVSGNVGSGQISDSHFASGTISPFSRRLSDSYTTAEPISGGRAVCFNGSGQAIIAMASVSGRMPAFGVTPFNYDSGIVLEVYRNGMLLNTIFSTDGLSGGISGLINQLVYVGRSGNLTGWFSGRLATPESSGDVQQAVGFGVSWSGIYLTD